MKGFGDCSAHKSEKILKTGNSLFTKGISAHRNGDIKKAEVLYLKALKLGLKHAGLYSNLGIIYKNSSRIKDAIKCFQEALKCDEKFADASANLATLHLQTGNYLEAQNEAERTLNIDPNHATCLCTLANIYRELGVFDKAKSFIQKSININSNNYYYYQVLGSIYLDLSDFTNAKKAMQKSLQLNESNIECYLMLSTACLGINDIFGAKYANTRAIEIDPLNYIANFNLGGIFNNLGDLDSALDYTLRAIDLNPTNATLFVNLAEIFKNKGEINKALQALERGIKLDPTNSLCHLSIGRIHSDLGDTSKSLHHFNIAKNDPHTSDNAIIEIAESYYYSGKFKEGLDLLANPKTLAQKSQFHCFLLCLDKRDEFIEYTKKLIAENCINSQIIASINHAKIAYKCASLQSPDWSSLGYIHDQYITHDEYSEKHIDTILEDLGCYSSYRDENQQLLLEKGHQTVGNILDNSKDCYKLLKELIIIKLQEYCHMHKVNVEKEFGFSWKQHDYILNTWAIVMNTGGRLKSHIHESGWLTGTFYLQIPERNESNGGGILFSQKGPHFPSKEDIFQQKILLPVKRTLNIFPSSIFHETIPFNSKQDRVCIAFDLRSA